MLFMGFDIIDSIQYAVDKIQEEYFKKESEDGELQFIVPYLYEQDKDGGHNSDKIILTIKHSKWTNSRVLFPTKDNYYGFNCLEDTMVDMFNQTM